jgi:hypothetical protein
MLFRQETEGRGRSPAFDVLPEPHVGGFLKKSIRTIAENQEAKNERGSCSSSRTAPTPGSCGSDRGIPPEGSKDVARPSGEKQNAPIQVDVQLLILMHSKRL